MFVKSNKVQIEFEEHSRHCSPLSYVQLCKKIRRIKSSNYVDELTMAPSCTILAARSATILAFLRALHCRTLHTARAAADVDATATKAERARGVDISYAGTNFGLPKKDLGGQRPDEMQRDATPQRRDPQRRCSGEPMGDGSVAEVNMGAMVQPRSFAVGEVAFSLSFRRHVLSRRATAQTARASSRGLIRFVGRAT